jgi:integrase/recombinase XerD
MGLERVFKASWSLRDLRSAPLGFLLDDFCDWLLDSGFTWRAARKHLSQVLHLNRWLAVQSWHGERLSCQDVDDFLAAYPGRCRNRGPLADHLKRIRHSLSRFVAFLRNRDMFDPQQVTPVYQPLLEAYLRWMRERQYAADATMELRCRSVKRFLVSLGDEATAKGLSGLSVNRIESYFLDHARSTGPSARRSMQAALRTFLRFCFHEGYIRQRLDHVVPTLRTYQLARVPRGLSEAQAQTVLESVDRSTRVGRRDYAILTLLHTYGVRGGQVRALRFDDIRWSQDQILFRATKGGKDSLLPLTAEAGESLLDYLRYGRPPSAFSRVFLTCRAPCRPFPRSSSLSEMVRRRIRAAGLDLPNQGAHAFRHAFATRMVAEGHPFKAVADVLGHRYLSTTFIYTKVNFNALSQTALEWPEEVNA